MTRQASIRPYLNQAYLMGLLMVAVGLTLSPFLMGMSQFWLILVWVADGIVGNRDENAIPIGSSVNRERIYFHPDFKQKLSLFWHNKAAVLLVAFYLMHIVGLLYTSDFQYAMKDLRVKLPILVMPFVLSSMPPLDRKRFDLVLLVYALSVFVATWFSFYAYVRHDYEDVREISRFISHIRFCLHIVFCMAVIGYSLFTRNAPWWSKAIQVVLLLWLGYQLFIFESLSGYVVFAAMVAMSALYVFLKWKKGRGLRIAVGVSALVVLLLGMVVVMRQVKPMLEIKQVDFSTLERKTAQGNDYWHDTVYNPVEDGKFVGLYYCRKEMQAAWPQRSQLPFGGTTTNGENLEATLARYLTSKGLRKDAEGVMALTDADIRNIEQGVANYNNWRHPGLRSRLSTTVFEYNMYRKFNNPNGGSLSQRIEFTRAAFRIIGRHPVFGVGTGDVPQAFSEAYDEIQSPLSKEFRFRAHNQYLSIMIAFGVVGLLVFLAVLLFPWLSSRKHRTYLYAVFLGIMLLSMLPEDTLETQAGASMFAFFVSMLLFAVPIDDESKTMTI